MNRTTEAQLSKIALNQFPPLQKTQICTIKLSAITSLSNTRWQNRKELPNRFSNNGDMAERAKRPVSGSVTSI